MCNRLNVCWIGAADTDHIEIAIVQVHYLQPRPVHDKSGVEVVLSNAVQPETVSVMMFAPNFAIPPGAPSHNVTAGCCVDGFLPLQPLAFRVHAHALGRRNWLEASAKPLQQGSAWSQGAVRRSCRAMTSKNLLTWHRT